MLPRRCKRTRRCMAELLRFQQKKRDKMPKISIVIPVFNGETYLKESIESVLSQSLTDWELILVNDCSTDSSLAIMESYHDSRIRIINNPSNQRLPKSLNIGFRAAAGEYLTWSSDDNCYGKNALFHMAQHLDNNPLCGLVYTDMYYMDEKGTVNGCVSRQPEQLFVCNVVGACFLYRKEAAQAIGEYDADMFLVEDYDYWLRMAKKYKICRLNEKDYFYRKHRQSLTETKAAEIARQLERLRMRELPFLFSQITEETKKCLFTDMALQPDSNLQQLEHIFYSSHLPSDLMWLREACSVKEIQKASQAKFILCGAGTIGQQTLRLLGENSVAFFADNNPALIGKEISGKKVISFPQIADMCNNMEIIVSVGSEKAASIACQLNNLGISHITYYNRLKQFSSASVSQG